MEAMTLGDGLKRAHDLKEAGKFGEAASLCRRILAQAPDLVGAHIVLAEANFRAGEIPGGYAAMDRVFALEPENETLRCHYVVILTEIGRHDEAMNLGVAALRGHPEWLEMRRLLTARALLTAKFAIARELAEAGPEDDDYLLYARSSVELRTQNWAAGFALYEARFAHYSQFRPTPLWQGERDPNGTLVLYDEQGLGDTIQFARFVPIARKLFGGRVILRAFHHLTRLLEGFADVVVTREDAIPTNAVYLSIVSLPYVLQRMGYPFTVAAPGAYFTPRPDLVARFAERLGPRRRLKRVGLAWHSGPKGGPLDIFRPLFEIPHIEWVSLQKDEAGSDPRLLDLMPEVADFADTAGLIANLDRVVSIDTSVLHLAGAMGAEAWGMLDTPCCWRWLDGTEHTPWYPNSVRLFRRPFDAEWSVMIDEVGRALSAG